jgi:transposase
MRGKSLFLIEEKKIPEYITKESNPEVKYRLAFLHAFIKTDYDLNKVCDIFCVAIPTAYVWVRKWNQQGYDGIAHPFHQSSNPAGRPPTLDECDMEVLKTLLDAKETWQTKDVRKLISDTWGFDFSPSQVDRILKEKLGMYFSKPYPHDYRRPVDAEEQLKNSIDNAYKSLINNGIDPNDIAVGFLDESSPQTTANTVRVWHIRRHVSVEKDTTKYKANAIGFYAIHGVSTGDFLPNSKSEAILDFLKKVRVANSDFKSVILILDNFSSHRSALVKEEAKKIGISLVFLPPYSPDLNPIEFIWKTVKRYVSVEFIGSLTQLRNIISKAWSESSNRCSFAKCWIPIFVPKFVNYREICE